MLVATSISATTPTSTRHADPRTAHTQTDSTLSNIEANGHLQQEYFERSMEIAAELVDVVDCNIN